MKRLSWNLCALCLISVLIGGPANSESERGAPQIERELQRSQLSTASGDRDERHRRRPPLLVAGLVNLEASPPILLLAGARFCDTPVVRAGVRDGGLRELQVFNSGRRFIESEWVGNDAGTHVVQVRCPAGGARIDLTVGAVGPQGPPGRDGLPPGQSCPDGAFAIGFDLEGILLCTERPVVSGVCPCFDDDEVSQFERLIRETLAAQPDQSTLACSLLDNLIDLNFGSYPVNGSTPTRVLLFARRDTCGVATQIPGAGEKEALLSPISPDESAACYQAIAGLSERLDCF